jgi:FkbM family methyltransferase
LIANALDEGRNRKSVMTLNGWLRHRARVTVDRIFCSSSADVQRVGDIDSGWVIKKSPAPVVVYCAGVGQGVSFELELAKTCPRPILVFDPSPTGMTTMAESDTHNIRFFPIGLAAKTGVIEFSLTEYVGQVSRSTSKSGFGKVSFDCWNLPTVMDNNGDTVIDLLKMDIEGFEYEIIDQFLDQRIPIRQLCVEFHPWLMPGRTFKTIARLYRAGYRIIYKHRGDHTFLLKEDRFSDLVKDRLEGSK